jgi:ABC-type cobalamin transport system permease subunit
VIEQGLRGYRVIQFGGAAIAIINIALLVFALRRSKKILVVGAVGAAVGVACVVLAPARELDTTLHSIILALAISVVASALFAWVAGRAGARPADAT